MGNVYVKSEFAPLKRVVLAESEFGFPMTNRLRNETFLPDVTKENVIGKNHADVLPERQRAWEKERENLKKVLEKYGVDVQKSRKLTEFEKKGSKEAGFSNYFVRDPFFVLGHMIVEGSLKPLYRRDEVLASRDILEKEARENQILYLAAPRPDASEGEDSEVGPFLEGGDILVWNKLIFVGQSGLATNDRGIQWLRNIAEHFGFQVVEVPLHPEILHLDCAISLVKEDLMLVCEEALLNGVPEELEDWDRIDVSLEEAKALAVNGLPINEEVYIMDPEFKEIGSQLEERDIQVEYIDFKITRQFGGAFRCSTQALLRM